MFGSPGSLALIPQGPTPLTGTYRPGIRFKWVPTNYRAYVIRDSWNPRMKKPTNLGRLVGLV